MGRLTKTEEFIRKANLVHNNLYDYSNTVYINSKTKLEIICKEHGSFWQTVGNHLLGKGCRLCQAIATSKRCRMTQEQYLEKVFAEHGNKYDYSKTEYKTTHDKIIITCQEHGDFSMKASHHLSGHGCSHCSKDKMSKLFMMSKEEILKVFKEVHGDTYDYSKLEYAGLKNYIVVGCPMHGDFKINANSHKMGNGCNKCSGKGFNFESLDSWLYVLQTDDIIKIGITSVNDSSRLETINRNSCLNFRQIKLYHFKDAKRCYNIEQAVLKKLKNKYRKLDMVFGGSTECFYADDIPYIISLIEGEISGN